MMMMMMMMMMSCPLENNQIESHFMDLLSESESQHWAKRGNQVSKFQK